MVCTYKITAHARPRVLARTIQLFDQQPLITRALIFERLNDELHIRVTIECELALAHRLEAKLHHQLDIHSVELLTNVCTGGDPGT